MMKNIKCRILIPVIAACLLAGCGSSSDSGLHYAIVTGPEGAAGDAAAVSNGITAYCTEHSYTMQTFTAAMDSDDAYAEQFKAAADAGAKYIVAAGSRMEIPVFAAQNAHKKSSFLMVNGEPRKNAESVSNIRGNTECLVPDCKGMGFVAGYVAVKEGYRRIGWLSGRETDSAKEYYEGFLNGVGYGMQEAGVSSDSMSVYTEFCGSDELSPRRLADAKSMYADGCELILTDKERIMEAVAMASSSSGKPCAAVGFEAASSANLQFSVVANWEGAVRALCASFDEMKGFEGGTSLVCGAAQGGIRLAADYSKMPVVTEVDVQTVLAAIANKQAVVSDDGGTENGPQPLGSTVSVTMREPVTGAAPSTGDAVAAEAEASSFVEVLE